jgi:outer membrane protein TolC
MRKLRVLLSILISACLLLGGCVPSQEKDTLRGRAGIKGMPDVPELGKEPALSDYLAYAALNNPGLEAAFNKWKASLEKASQAGYLPDPNFTYGNYIEQVETRVGPQEQSFAFMQKFPWFGKRALRKDIAAQAARAQKARYDAAKLKLFNRVKNAYYEYYFLGRAISITEENVKLVKYLEEVARTKYKTGSAPHSTVIQAQIELSKLEDRLEQLRDFRKPIVAGLNAALGRPSKTNLPWPKKISEAEISVDEKALIDAIGGSPELARLDAEIAKSESALKLAAKEKFPDLTLGLKYIATGGASMAGIGDSGKDPIIGMIAFNLPLWFGKYKAQEREARRNLDAAILSRADKENELTVSLETSLYRYRDANRKTILYRDDLIPKVKEGLEVIRQSLKTGTKDVSDLISAHRTVLGFTLIYEKMLTVSAQRLAEMEMLTGRDFQRAGETESVNKEDKQ